MPPDAASPLRETTIVVRLRACDPPEGRVIAGEQELAFTGWVALLSLLNQLAGARHP